jgi:hypothetical protein
MASTVEYFKLALTYLLKKRIAYNDIAQKNHKDTGRYNYDFTNAYSQIIQDFKNSLNSKIIKISNENSLSNYGNFQNIWNNIGVNIHDFPLSKFLISMLPEIDFYPQIIKEIIMDYSKIFNENDYRVNYDDDTEIIILYFSKLLVKVLYYYKNDPIKYINDISELNKLTKQYGVEYYLMSTYAAYHSDIVYKIITLNKSNIKPIIEYLEIQYKNIEIIENLKLKLKEIPKAEIPKAEIPKAEIPKAEIPNGKAKVESKKSKEKLNEKDEQKSAQNEQIDNTGTSTIGSKEKTKKIPAAVRKIVWHTYIGKDNATGKCLVCNSEDISYTNFECGHVKSRANGGDITIENLRPICGNCNKSISGNDMDEFMDKFKIKKSDNWNGLNQTESNNTEQKHKTKEKNGNSLESDIELLNFEINKNTYNNVYKCKCKEKCSNECKILETTIADNKDAINKQYMKYYLDNISKKYHIINININLEKTFIKILINVNKSKKTGNINLYYTNNLDDAKTIKYKKIIFEDTNNNFWLYEL